MLSKGRPWVGCHILMSIDGRIAGPFMECAAAAPAAAAYRESQIAYEADALVYGATTARGFAGSRISCFSPGIAEPEGDYIAPAAAAPYCVSIDPMGEVAWESGVLSRPGRPDAHVIEVLSACASGAYRAYLREHGVSYLVAGDERIDLPSAVDKLARLFGVTSLLVCGGGAVNASFLSAGLIDELSVVIAPVASGKTGVPTLFDESAFASVEVPVDFALEYAEALAGGVVRLVYSRAGLFGAESPNGR